MVRAATIGQRGSYENWLPTFSPAALSPPSVTVYVLVTKIGPSSMKRTGPMTILRFGPLPAIAGAACLVAWTPEGRAPEPAPSLAISAPKLASPFPDVDPSKLAHGRAANLESPSTVGAIPAGIPAPSVEADRSDKEVKVQLAYADLEGAAPALGALSAVTPRAEMAALEPSAPPPAAQEPSAPAAAPALPPPPRTS